MIIIFLDIDGVLLSLDAPYSSEDPVSAFDKAALSCLNELILEIKQKDSVGIVISSDWRQSYKVTELKNTFKCHAFAKDIIGKTIDKKDSSLPDYHRGKKIKSWLSAHRDLKISNFIILDDNAFDITTYFQGQFVHCESGVLNAKNLQQAKHILTTIAEPIKDNVPKCLHTKAILEAKELLKSKPADLSFLQRLIWSYPGHFISTLAIVANPLTNGRMNS